MNEEFDFLITFIIGKHMKMLCFKFQQNHTIYEELDFLRGGWRGGGAREPHL